MFAGGPVGVAPDASGTRGEMVAALKDLEAGFQGDPGTRLRRERPGAALLVYCYD